MFVEWVPIKLNFHSTDLTQGRNYSDKLISHKTSNLLQAHHQHLPFEITLLHLKLTDPPLQNFYLTGNFLHIFPICTFFQNEDIFPDGSGLAVSPVPYSPNRFGQQYTVAIALQKVAKAIPFTLLSYKQLMVACFSNPQVVLHSNILVIYRLVWAVSIFPEPRFHY